MKHFHSILFACVAVSFALTGCGGGGGGSATLPSTPSSQLAATNFQITIPQVTQSVGLGPKYVSPNTQSATISSTTALSVPAGSPCVAGTNSVTCNTTGTSSGCALTGGNLVCTFSLIAAVGNDQFTVTMFSGTSGGGSQLSTGSVSAAVSATGSNLIPITLNGVVDQVAITLANTSPQNGASVTIPVTVTAKDPSGATIVGPGNYTVPITLTDSDSSGATTLSTTTVSGPGATVTLTYNGSASLTSATIGATVSGVAASKITSATLTPAAAAKQISGGTSALAILTINGTTYAFVPAPGGITQVPIASAAGLASARRKLGSSAGPIVIAINPAPQECAADPGNGKIYCIAFSSNVINVLDATQVPATVIDTFTTDAPTAGYSFSGATCVICSISFDPTDSVAIFSSANGYEFFDYKANKITKTITAPISENFGYNAVTNQIWSPQYGFGKTSSTPSLDLVDVKSGTKYTLASPPQTVKEPDAGAVDNSTNIAIAPEEQAGATSTLYMVALNSAQLGAPAAGQFTASAVAAPIVSSLGSSNGRLLDGMAIDSQGHMAFFADEFRRTIGVAQLPSTGSGTPALGDYAFSQLPAQPDGNTWYSAGDPHSVAAFNLPNTCADCAALFNGAGTYTAIVDMNKLKSATRDATDTHLVAAGVDLICNGIVTFVPTKSTGPSAGGSGCATLTTPGLAASGGTLPVPSTAGFNAAATYGANNGGVTLNLRASTEPPPGVSIPTGANGTPFTSGTPFLYASVTPSANLTFTSQGFSITSLTVPSWLSPSAAYNYYAFDLTSQVYCGSNGPGTYSGGTVTYPGGGSGTGGSNAGSGCIDNVNKTVPAGHQMMVVFTYQ